MIRSARFFVQFRRMAKTTGARDDSVRRGFVGAGRTGSAAPFGGLRIEDGRFVTGIPGAPFCAGHA